MCCYSGSMILEKIVLMETIIAMRTRRGFAHRHAWRLVVTRTSTDRHYGEAN
jgi:hypothetical protein